MLSLRMLTAPVKRTAAGQSSNYPTPLMTTWPGLTPVTCLNFPVGRLTCKLPFFVAEYFRNGRQVLGSICQKSFQNECPISYPIESLQVNCACLPRQTLAVMLALLCATLPIGKSCSAFVFLHPLLGVVKSNSRLFNFNLIIMCCFFSSVSYWQISKPFFLHMNTTARDLKLLNISFMHEQPLSYEGLRPIKALRR